MKCIFTPILDFGKWNHALVPAVFLSTFLLASIIIWISKHKGIDSCRLLFSFSFVIIFCFEYPFPQVAGFVASLQMFFMYGLTNKSRLVCQNPGSKEEFSSLSLSSRSEESSKSERGTYRPPHLRKRGGMSIQAFRGWNAQSISSCEASSSGISSSDSEHSDNDGSMKGIDQFRSSRARIAAIFCIQVRLHILSYFLFVATYSFILCKA